MLHAQITGKVQGELPAGGAAGFFTDKPTKFKRVGDSVYVYEDVPTAMGRTMKGLAIHTFDDQGKCVHTAPYHFLYTSRCFQKSNQTKQTKTNQHKQWEMQSKVVAGYQGLICRKIIIIIRVCISLFVVYKKTG